MTFTIEIEEREDGAVEARCSELGLMAVGEDLEEVIDQMKELLLLHLSEVEELGLEPGQSGLFLHLQGGRGEGKYYHFPRYPKVH